MFGIRSVATSLACFILLPGSLLSQTDQLLPEVDLYYKTTPEVRVWFQAEGTRESGEALRAEIGPSLDLYLKPWTRLKGAAEFDLDDAKSRPLLFSIGYRVMPASGLPTQNRLEPVITFNVPMKARFLLTDRNRGDLDWVSGRFSWRYRNRVQLERAVPLRGYHVRPYISTEFFYTSQYDKWSDTALYLGRLFPIGRHVEFNPYYEHQNNTGVQPNQQLNQLGLMLNLFFGK